MNPLKGFFVTGTDTGIGKTWVSCGVITALQKHSQRVIGMKPIASGCQQTPQGLRNEDALLLQAASSVSIPYESINLYAFEPAIAPHIAAAEVGRDMDFSWICEMTEALTLHADYLVVEGVGGWRVPLGKQGDVGALASALKFPIILVVGVRLGCLNHAFLTADAIQGTGLTLAGWVANIVDPNTERLDDNLEALRVGIAAPCLGVTPYLATFEPEHLVACLHLDSLLAI
jgi:dethiobiotin synthetase